MEHGDISNEVVPRLLIAFEGMLGILPEKHESAVEFALRRFGRRQRTAQRSVDAYEINDALARVIWDTTWRHRYSVDVVTYLGEDAVAPLEARLDVEGLPIGRVWSTTPERLARRLPYMPDVAAVFDNDHHLIFGSKGRMLPAAPTTLIGAL
ncbi:hypothetical protein PV336_15965 [Streptomyces sp. MI02-2A]|uniref:hypothetical protein n=1 Tax=Streptomyces sp. MI02-2A TaxID=3028688 RepID=UPI0029B80D21|nr:hypothetical protein [Streptomyces sp. MI02-2A]MDX3260716.1 hypothetical protein [Streptomyces sp. MI02-2A]